MFSFLNPKCMHVRFSVAPITLLVLSPFGSQWLILETFSELWSSSVLHYSTIFNRLLNLSTELFILNLCFLVLYFFFVYDFQYFTKTVTLIVCLLKCIKDKISFNLWLIGSLFRIDLSLSSAVSFSFNYIFPHVSYNLFIIVLFKYNLCAIWLILLTWVIQ